MSPVEWLPAAREDLVRLHAFIRPHSEDAAARAVQTIMKAVEQLKETPEIGRPWGPDPAFRELHIRFGAKGYAARYRLFEERVIIVRVWHALEER